MKRLFLLALVILFSCTSSTPKVTHLTILYTSFTSGRMKPCGCHIPRGGFPRRATLISDVKAMNDNVILIDGGNTLNENPKIGDPAEELKGDYLYKFYHMLNYDILAIGATDFALGKDFIQKMIKKYNFDFILSNNIDPKVREELKLLPYKIITKGKVKIGVLNYISDFFMREKKLDFLKGRLIPEDISKGVEELNPKVNVIFLILNSGAYYGKQILDQLPQSTLDKVDMIFLSHTFYPEKKIRVVSKRDIISIGREAKYAALFKCNYHFDSDSLKYSIPESYKAISLDKDVMDDLDFQKIVNEYEDSLNQILKEKETKDK